MRLLTDGDAYDRTRTRRGRGREREGGFIDGSG